MADEPKESPPVGVTASIIHESRKVGETLLGADSTKAVRWMVFILVAATLGLAGWLGLRSIISFETVIGMILRSKEDQAERDRQHFSTECEKVRAHCSRETEQSALREQSRADKAALLFSEERVKDRTANDQLGRMVRDELIAIRIMLGKLKLPPEVLFGMERNPVPNEAVAILLECGKGLARIW